MGLLFLFLARTLCEIATPRQPGIITLSFCSFAARNDEGSFYKAKPATCRGLCFIPECLLFTSTAFELIELKHEREAKCIGKRVAVDT